MKVKREMHRLASAAALHQRCTSAKHTWVSTRTAAVILLLLAETLCVSAHANQLHVDPMFGVQVTRDIPYGSSATGSGVDKPRLLDLYRPVGPDLPDRLPAIVLMHGGSFVFGNKQGVDVLTYTNAFASRGYVTVSINYRLLLADSLPQPPGAPLDPHPSRFPGWLLPQLADWGVTVEQYFAEIAAAVADQAMAVDWLVDNADAYGIDPRKIAVGGSSAGAVSSLLLGIGAVDGATADVGAVFSEAGGTFGWESFVNAGDPGVFMLHGDRDDVVPFAEVAFLEAAYADAGLPFEKHIGEGIGHDYRLPMDLFADPAPMFEFMIGQLNRHALTGDFNRDGEVNAADYVVWRNNNGTDMVLWGDPTPGVVDQSDYDVWRTNFGNSLITAPSGGTAIPESSTFLFACMAGLSMLGRRRRWPPDPLKDDRS